MCGPCAILTGQWLLFTILWCLVGARASSPHTPTLASKGHLSLGEAWVLTQPTGRVGEHPLWTGTGLGLKDSSCPHGLMAVTQCPEGCEAGETETCFRTSNGGRGAGPGSWPGHMWSPNSGSLGDDPHIPALSAPRGQCWVAL